MRTVSHIHGICNYMSSKGVKLHIAIWFWKFGNCDELQVRATNSFNVRFLLKLVITHITDFFQMFSGCSSYSTQCNISKMLQRNLFKIGSKVYLVSVVKWWVSGGQNSKALWPLICTIFIKAISFSLPQFYYVYM